jgi:hypothetical protein
MDKCHVYLLVGLSARLRIRLNVILCFAAFKTYLRIRLGIYISLIHYLLKVHLKRHRYNLVFAFSSLFSVLHCSLHFSVLLRVLHRKDVKNLFFSIDRSTTMVVVSIERCLFVCLFDLIYDLWSTIYYSYSKKSCSSPPWILFNVLVVINRDCIFLYLFWLYDRLVVVNQLP